ncbi:MAG: hypothetical protein JRI90_18240 [Deltaproteobacteria bacterium]|nr:hypothetical protein [Deltaproteobacteria bacterium]
MKRKYLLMAAIASVLLLVFGSLTWAQDWTARRQMRQYRRIEQGVRSGEITRGRRAWRDGYLSCAERRRLDRMLDRASRHIYRAKHNPLVVRRPWRPICRPVYPPPVRRPPIGWIWPGETISHFSGFFWDPTWAFAWSVTIP